MWLQQAARAFYLLTFSKRILNRVVMTDKWGGNGRRSDSYSPNKLIPINKTRQMNSPPAKPRLCVCFFDQVRTSFLRIRLGLVERAGRKWRSVGVRCSRYGDLWAVQSPNVAATGSQGLLLANRLIIHLSRVEMTRRGEGKGLFFLRIKQVKKWFLFKKIQALCLFFCSCK